MVKKRFQRLIVFGVLLLFIVSGCAKPPKKEIEGAERALENAKLKEAHLYAEETFKKAEDTLGRAKSLVTQKKYKEAKELAIEAEKLARKAEEEVASNKAKMKEEAETLLSDIKAAIDEAKKIFPLLARKKVISKDEAQNLLGKWEFDLSTLKESLSAGKIREARDKAQSLLKDVRTKMDEIKK